MPLVCPGALVTVEPTLTPLCDDVHSGLATRPIFFDHQLTDDGEIIGLS